VESPLACGFIIFVSPFAPGSIRQVRGRGRRLLLAGAYADNRAFVLQRITFIHRGPFRSL